MMMRRLTKHTSSINILNYNGEQLNVRGLQVQTRQNKKRKRPSPQRSIPVRSHHNRIARDWRLRLENHRERLLQLRFESREPRRTHRTVHHSVITAQRCSHHRRHSPAFLRSIGRRDDCVTDRAQALLGCWW